MYAGVAQVVAVLTEAKSSSLPNFLALRDLIQKEADVARSNVRFLQILESPCQALAKAKPQVHSLPDPCSGGTLPSRPMYWPYTPFPTHALAVHSLSDPCYGGALPFRPMYLQYTPFPTMYLRYTPFQTNVLAVHSLLDPCTGSTLPSRPMYLHYTPFPTHVLAVQILLDPRTGDTSLSQPIICDVLGPRGGNKSFRSDHICIPPVLKGPG